jgi:hypothetical protein
MPQMLQSKKMIVSLVGILAVFVLALLGRDIEMVKWVGGFVAGIVSTLNVSQGFADGLSRGKTSLAAQSQDNR